MLGLFVRSDFDDRARVTSGWSVQVDSGWGTGALLVRRWSNDWETHPGAVTEIARQRLFGSHTLAIDIVGDVLKARGNDAEVRLDLGGALRRLGEQWSTADGDQVAVRTLGRHAAARRPHSHPLTNVTVATPARRCEQGAAVRC